MTGDGFDIDPCEKSGAGRVVAEVPFRLSRTEWLLLVGTLIFVAATRLYGIVDFPIFFFCDEALHANLARELVDSGLRDEHGVLLPTYFRNVRVYNLGLSVWIHALPLTFFGPSIFLVRATSVVIGLLGTASLMLALKWFFGTRLWWAAGLVMAALPAWFLHSRTAFETVMMTSFYAVFVLAYLLYRCVSPWWLPAAVTAGAATFYSYSNGQGVMFVSAVLLLIVDFRYHWRVLRRSRRATAVGLLALVVVSVPYLRHRDLHPQTMAVHLDDLRSYWVADLSTNEKVERFLATYLRGMSPTYWFTEDEDELDRHRMLGYPHLPVWLAPAVLLGLAASAWRSPRSPAARLVWIGVLAAPFAASLVGLRITRVLAMIVPATLAATIGLDILRGWLVAIWSTRRVANLIIGTVVGVALAGATLAMMRDALVNGPLWFRDYGLYGMQWGAKELFRDLRVRLGMNPWTRFVISHIWANNPNTFSEFFLEPDDVSRVLWLSVDEMLRQRHREVEGDTVFVITAEEFERAVADPKLQVDPHRAIISDPAGDPAFYIVRLAYSPQADALFLAEAEERRRLVESAVPTADGSVLVRHPVLDSGSIGAAFDGNPGTLARTFDANPTRVMLELPTPRPLSGLRLHLWTARYRITLSVITAGGERVETTRDAVSGDPPVPIEVLLPTQVTDATGLELTIAKDGDVHIHLREIEMLP